MTNNEESNENNNETDILMENTKKEDLENVNNKSDKNKCKKKGKKNTKITDNNNSENDIKDKEDNENLNNGEEKQKRISYFQLYRYVSKRDAWLLFFGVITSVAMGWAYPLMINNMGDVLGIMMSLVSNVFMKKTTFINDDNIIYELIKILQTPNQDNKEKLANFGVEHPRINVNSTIKRIEEAYGSDYSTISFKPHDTIWIEIKKYLLIYLLLGLLAFVASTVSNTLLTIFSTRQGINIRTLGFKSIVNQEIAWHEKNNPGELLARLIGDVAIVESGIGSSLSSIIIDITTIIVCFSIAFYNSWLLSLEMGSLIPVFFLTFIIFVVFLTKYTKKTRDLFGEAGNIALEAISKIRIIASFGNEECEVKRYKKTLKKARKYEIILAAFTSVVFGIIFIIMFGSYCIIFRFGTKYIYEGKVTAAQVYKVFLSILHGTSSITNLSSTIGVIAQSSAAATTIFNIIDRKPKYNNEEGEKPEKPLKGDIEFRDVCFSYPSRPEVPILKNISFKCPSGKTIAIVGASGSGKSTIVQLLERFYSIDSGEILIDGVPIENYNIPWLRSQYGVVSQNPVLFEGTIAENIKSIHYNATQEDVENAAKSACIHDFIKALSNGYDTNINESGINLSGGQKQRICIARAFLSNPTILLLDEATSSLDNKSEKIIQNALNSIGNNITKIIVAHRLSTIKNADSIIVMDKGEIVEIGTHDELMNKKDKYFHLIKNQEMNIDHEPIFDEEEEEDENTRRQKRISKQQETILNQTLSRSSICDSLNDNTHNRNSLIKLQNLITSSTIPAENSIISYDYEDYAKKDKENKENDENNNNDVDEGEKALLNKYIDKGLDTVTKEEFANIRVFKKMHWKRFIQLNKKYWFLFLLGLLGTLMTSCLQSSLSYIYAATLNSFNEHGEKLLQSGYYWSSVFIFLGIIACIANIADTLSFQSATALLAYHLRGNMFKNILHQEIAYFDQHKEADLNDQVMESTESISDNNSGSLTSKLSLEVDLMSSINKNISEFIYALFGFIISIIIAFICSWKISLFISTVVPCSLISIYMRMKAIRNKNELIRMTIVNSSNVVSEVVTNIKTVMELNLQDKYITKYSSALNKPQKSLERKYFNSNIWSGITNMFQYIAAMIGLYCSARFIENNTVNFTLAYTVINAFDATLSSILSISNIAPNYDKAVEAFGHILEILDRKSAINSSDKSGITKRDPAEADKIQAQPYEDEEFLKCNVEMKDLKFAYPSRPKNIILNFDEKNNAIKLPFGKKCGIVGSSGCGKSTLIALLLRWYDPNRGGIYIDQINTKDYNLKWLRNQMSIVSQDPSLFNMTIRDNIRYGKLDATQEEIEMAAKKANIHDFIVSLPEGYDTVIGGTSTSKMSGGQKQRIAIARAIIREPKILLLDEATSALDAESELLVQKALDEFSSGRTTIAIAHRLSTLKDFDFLIVIKDGKIEEMGTPEELLMRNGEYSSLVKAGNLK